MMAPASFAGRGLAIHTVRGFLKKIASRTDVEVQIIDGPRIAAAKTNDATAARAAFDSAVGRHTNPGPGDLVDGNWWRRLADALEDFSNTSGDKSLLYLVENPSFCEDDLAATATRAGVAVYPVSLWRVDAGDYDNGWGWGWSVPRPVEIASAEPYFPVVPFAPFYGAPGLDLLRRLADATGGEMLSTKAKRLVSAVAPLP